MPDSQDKSDDLIAELAKLMASNAGAAAEPESKPAPKLVTLPEAQRPDPAPAAPVRIPGMDTPTPAPAAAKPAPVAAPPSSLRIPGMDQPVPVSTVPPVTAPPPVETKPAASFDFGAAPAAASIKPEPMSNWQDREIPKPVPSRPAPMTPPKAAEPEVPDEADDAAEAAPAVGSQTQPSGASSSPMVAAAKASPPTDSFDFDFGFTNDPPGPIATQPEKAAAAPVAKDSADPIADLIAAELDFAEAEVPQDAPRPAPRSFAPPASPIQGPRPSQPAAPQASRPAAPAPRAEDRFGVAPVFGPAGRSQAAARPQQSPDPIEEIESLIGEAVRVELTGDGPDVDEVAPQPEPPPAPPRAAAPVVPPLTAGLPPRRATIKDRDSDVRSPEAAIIAAAGGADAGSLDGVTGEPSPYKRVKAKPERRSGGMRQYVGMAVAGTLLLAAGFGLYWVLGMGRGGDAEAPVLQADATPVKEVPAPSPVDTSTQQGAVVFNELDGGNAEAPADEQLVSRDDTAETSVADVARTVGDVPDAPTESELANRKVRTVTVRPDGTIVSGDEAVAGNEELPVDRPDVPEIAGADVQPSELLAAIPTDAVAATNDVASETATGDDTTTLAALSPVEPTSTANINPNIIAPIPVARPTDRAALASASSQQATTQPVAVQQPAAPQTVSGSGPYVQLSSQPTQPDAENSLRATQNRLSSLLSGRALAIRQVDLGAKGTWYRVVLPVDSFQEATQTCASFKANGIDCVPIGG